jgi:hypothetical protein
MLTPLREALKHWSADAKTPHVAVLDEIAASWSEMVGKEIASNSRPAEISGESLLVVTRSNTWSEQLSFLAEPILASLREHFGLEQVRRLRFRTGRMRHLTPSPAKGSEYIVRRFVTRKEPSASLDEAIALFRADVEAARRAKSARASNNCERCAAPVSHGTLCVACANRAEQERERLVSRLLFEVPWLGYAGIAALVQGLTRDEYESIRVRTLARWWAALARVQRSGRLSRDGRERLIGSSYVMVKSGLEPEQIAPATMRNLLGDELMALLYGNEKK